jgi:hypothetical protein
MTGVRRNVARQVADGETTHASDRRGKPGPVPLRPGRNRPDTVRISVPNVFVNRKILPILVEAGIQRQGDSPECRKWTVVALVPYGRESRLHAVGSWNDSGLNYQKSQAGITGLCRIDRENQSTSECRFPSLLLAPGQLALPPGFKIGLKTTLHLRSCFSRRCQNLLFLHRHALSVKQCRRLRRYRLVITGERGK